MENTENTEKTELAVEGAVGEAVVFGDDPAGASEAESGRESDILRKADPNTSAQLSQREIRHPARSGGEETVGGRESDTLRKADPNTSAQLSQREIRLLAHSDAEDIISGGPEQVLREAARLAAIGPEAMTAREKALFTRLAGSLQESQRLRELQALGVDESVAGSPEFRDFAAKFRTDTPMAEIWALYRAVSPAKGPATLGSMKNTAPPSGVKDFYSREEALRFSKKDFDRDPALYRAVQASMVRW